MESYTPYLNVQSGRTKSKVESQHQSESESQKSNRKLRNQQHLVPLTSELIHAMQDLKWKIPPIELELERVRKFSIIDCIRSKVTDILKQFPQNFGECFDQQDIEGVIRRNLLQERKVRFANEDDVQGEPKREISEVEAEKNNALEEIEMILKILGNDKNNKLVIENFEILESRLKQVEQRLSGLMRKMPFLDSTTRPPMKIDADLVKADIQKFVNMFNKVFTSTYEILSNNSTNISFLDDTMSSKNRLKFHLLSRLSEPKDLKKSENLLNTTPNVKATNEEVYSSQADKTKFSKLKRGKFGLKHTEGKTQPNTEIGLTPVKAVDSLITLRQRFKAQSTEWRQMNLVNNKNKILNKTTELHLKKTTSLLNIGNNIDLRKDEMKFRSRFNKRQIDEDVFDFAGKIINDNIRRTSKQLREINKRDRNRGRRRHLINENLNLKGYEKDPDTLKAGELIVSCVNEKVFENPNLTSLTREKTSRFSHVEFKGKTPKGTPRYYHSLKPENQAKVSKKNPINSLTRLSTGMKINSQNTTPNTETKLIPTLSKLLQSDEEVETIECGTTLPEEPVEEKPLSVEYKTMPFLEIDTFMIKENEKSSKKKTRKEKGSKVKSKSIADSEADNNEAMPKDKTLQPMGKLRRILKVDKLGEQLNQKMAKVSSRLSMTKLDTFDIFSKGKRTKINTKDHSSNEANTLGSIQKEKVTKVPDRKYHSEKADAQFEGLSKQKTKKVLRKSSVTSGINVLNSCVKGKGQNGPTKQRNTSREDIFKLSLKEKFAKQSNTHRASSECDSINTLGKEKTEYKNHACKGNELEPFPKGKPVKLLEGLDFASEMDFDNLQKGDTASRLSLPFDMGILRYLAQDKTIKTMSRRRSASDISTNISPLEDTTAKNIPKPRNTHTSKTSKEIPKDMTKALSKINGPLKADTLIENRKRSSRKQPNDQIKVKPRFTSLIKVLSLRDILNESEILNFLAKEKESKNTPNENTELKHVTKEKVVKNVAENDLKKYRRKPAMLDPKTTTSLVFDDEDFLMTEPQNFYALLENIRDNLPKGHKVNSPFVQNTRGKAPKESKAKTVLSLKNAKNRGFKDSKGDSKKALGSQMHTPQENAFTENIKENFPTDQNTNESVLEDMIERFPKKSKATTDIKVKFPKCIDISITTIQGDDVKKTYSQGIIRDSLLGMEDRISDTTKKVDKFKVKELLERSNFIKPQFQSMKKKDNHKKSIEINVPKMHRIPVEDRIRSSPFQLKEIHSNATIKTTSIQSINRSNDTSSKTSISKLSDLKLQADKIPRLNSIFSSENLIRAKKKTNLKSSFSSDLLNKPLKSNKWFYSKPIKHASTELNLLGPWSVPGNKIDTYNRKISQKAKKN